MRSDVYLMACLLFRVTPRWVTAYSAALFPRRLGGRWCGWRSYISARKPGGAGLGSAFFSWLEQTLPAARYRLEVEPDNLGAIRLYRRKGYAPLPYLQMVRDFPPGD